MVKPDTLWAFLKTAKDDVVVGRICRSLGGQMVSPPLNQLEEALLKVIAQGNEWHTEAIDKDLSAKRREPKESPKSPWRKRRKRILRNLLLSIRPSIHPSIRPVLKKM